VLEGINQKLILIVLDSSKATKGIEMRTLSKGYGIK
jgi:hypothetical protein